MRSAICTCSGHSLIGEFSGHKSGHALNNKLLRTLLADAPAWEEVVFERYADAPISYIEAPALHAARRLALHGAEPSSLLRGNTRTSDADRSRHSPRARSCFELAAARSAAARDQAADSANTTSVPVPLGDSRDIRACQFRGQMRCQPGAPESCCAA